MAGRKWLVLNERLREMRVALSGLREDTRLLPGVQDALTEIQRDLQLLRRVQETRAQFAEQVRAVQAERLPESFELTMAKQILEVARHVLLNLEWSGMAANKPCCPICRAAKGTGHTRSCALFQVIGPPRLADSA